MSPAVVGALVAVVVVVVGLLVTLLVRRRRTPVLGDVSQPGTAGQHTAPPPDAGSVPGVDERLAGADTIGAVRAYRDATGASLRDATDAVRRRQHGAAVGTADLAEVRALAGQGQLILAIKRYRELTGAGLADAKRAVENIAREPAATGAPAYPSGPDLSEVQQLVLSGRKIQAIKVYRQVTGASLAEAKAAVENGRW